MILHKLKDINKEIKLFFKVGTLELRSTITIRKLHKRDSEGFEAKRILRRLEDGLIKLEE